MNKEKFIDDKIIFVETEIKDFYDIMSIKHSHVGSIMLESQTNKFVFIPKVKENGTPLFYKAWYLAKILTKLNELNKQFTEVNK